MLWVLGPIHAKLPVNIGPYLPSKGLPKMGVVPYKTRAFFLMLYDLFYYTLVHFLWVIMCPLVPRRAHFFSDSRQSFSIQDQHKMTLVYMFSAPLLHS